MTVTNADIAGYAQRLDAIAMTAWRALDDEGRDRQTLLENLCGDAWHLAELMTAGISRCDMPECTDATHTTQDASR